MWKYYVKKMKEYNRNNCVELLQQILIRVNKDNIGVIT